MHTQACQPLCMNRKEHVPIESFVTTLIDRTFVAIAGTKLASVEVMCFDEASSEVTCGELMWLFATCDVMSCDVISC